MTKAETFTVQERIVLVEMLPSSGSAITMRAVDELLRTVGFADAELDQAMARAKQLATEHGQPYEPGNMDFRDASPVTVELSITMRHIIRAKLKSMDEQEQLTVRHLSLYNRFCPEGDDEATTKEEV